MTRRKTALLVLGAALLLGLGEVVARVAAPRPRGFAIRPEVHPLLGEAPAGSFARAPDEPELRDYQGRPFPRRKSQGTTRVLLLGARRAASPGLAPALVQHARKTPCEVIAGAREGYAPLQHFFVYSAFGRALELDAVVVVDGLEVLAAAPPYPGYTPAWTRHRRALAHPLVAALSEQSRLFTLLVGEPILGPDAEVLAAAKPEDVARFASDARSLAVLCEGDEVPLVWITLGDRESGYEPPAARARLARLAAGATDDEIALTAVR